MTTTALRIFIEADVKCFHCGQTGGSDPQEQRALSDPVAPLSPTGQPTRCLSLGFEYPLPTLRRSSYVDEFQTRYEFPPVEFSDEAPRRGRPPKRLVEMRQGAA